MKRYLKQGKIFHKKFVSSLLVVTGDDVDDYLVERQKLMIICNLYKSDNFVVKYCIEYKLD